MADEMTTTDTETVEGQPADAEAPGNDEVQEVADTETEQGYRGVEVDQTPNENYTVAGVTSGAPTPETDAEAKDNALRKA